MKAMIWKEWRENLQWAALACLIFCLPLFDALIERTLTHRVQRSESFTMTMSILMALPPFFAAALGLLQVGPELRRDQWAFLVHRPVSRSLLFAGKAVAGLSLFGAAVLIPLLAVLLFQSPEPNSATRELEVLPMVIVQLITSVGFYFAGMLTAVRPARWYGSRVFGFFAALVCLALVSISYGESGRITPLLLIPIFGVAAWGSFLTTGEYARQPRVAKIALGVTLYLGILGIMGVVTACVASAVESATHDSQAIQRFASRSEVPPATLALVYVEPTYLPIGITQDAEPSVRAGALSALGYALWVSLAVSPLTFLVARRASLSKKAIWGWTVATVPLGISAVFLLLALREWPARVACPSCHKKRSVQNELCEHCGAPFPRPVPDETWIFEAQDEFKDLLGILDAA